MTETDCGGSQSKQQNFTHQLNDLGKNYVPVHFQHDLIESGKATYPGSELMAGGTHGDKTMNDKKENTNDLFTGIRPSPAKPLKSNRLTPNLVRFAESPLTRLPPSP
jgi:hypothetical protein